MTAADIEPTATPDYARFAIGFDPRDRARFHQLIDEVIDSNQWSHSSFNQRFEEAWGAWNNLGAVATGSWAGGTLAALDFAGVKGETVLCPSNTFAATPFAAIRAGAEVQFVDCNREDLCMSFEDFERKAEQYKPKAAMLVHIGGHIAFDSEKIAAYCADNGIFLFEDCAHAHGADWNGRKPGSYGDAGLLEHARAFRNYGKPTYEIVGLNYRMSEFTAALGLIQTERMPEIVEFKNEIAREYLDPQFPGSKLALPDGMTSGFYKYIVFDWLEKSTGRVYDEPCHRLFGHQVELPNTDWVAEHHSCPPLYYRPVLSD
jgi:dTDP-4-amino-4,6-dideoxygalactose transaminase